MDESEALDEIMVGVYKHNFVDPTIKDDLRNEILNEYRVYLRKKGKA